MENDFFYRETLESNLEGYKERQYWIDGLLYEHSSLLFYAADGVGKSVLTLQMMLEAGNQTPVFGGLSVWKPLRTLWIMAERHPLEMFERIIPFKKSIGVNLENFAITTAIQGMNLLNEKQFEEALIKITDKVNLMGDIDVIVVDPIYALVSGGMKEDEGVSQITRFSTAIQNLFNCSVIFIHHTNRGQKMDNGQRSEGDMYGNRFLSAHFTGTYHIMRTSSGSKFVRNKSSHKNLIDTFELEFDYESYVSTVKDDSFNKKDRLLMVLRRFKNAGKKFYLSELEAQSECSPNYLMKLFRTELKSVIVREANSNGRKTLYDYIGN